jgi:hypothetical protein
MGHVSHPEFVTLHALRIRGFAQTAVLAEMTAQPVDHVQAHLDSYHSAGHVQFREARGLWQLTPDGRELHATRLVADLEACAEVERLTSRYHDFLDLNGRFKELCGEWQLKDGAPNDHSDPGYDAAVIERLALLHDEARPIVSEFGEVMVRFQPYAPRLEDVCRRVGEGETHMFTGVMCGSYHDVWMELHEDLILTQRIDRGAEGSF